MPTFYIESAHFTPFPGPWHSFRTSQTQDIGRDLYKRGLKLQALARASVPHRTGLLAGSIYVNYSAGFLNPSVTIGSNVPYAYVVHEGASPHLITPHRGRVLRFVHNGRVVYARKVNHPGSRATRFLARHLRTVVR